MLDLDKLYGPYAGLAIFGDHADPSLFYYVPRAPALALRDGEPEISFLKYRRDLTDNPALDGEAKKNLGGGFLAFTVELAVSEEDLKEAGRELARLGFSEPRLVPVPFRAGTASLAMVLSDAKSGQGSTGAPQGAGLQFFERVLGETKPTLAGTNRATFSMVMPTHEDAELVEGMLRGGGVTPIGVRYELEYTGLRPAIKAKLTAHYDRVYHKLEQQLGVGGTYMGIGLSVDLGRMLQELQEEGAITIDLTELTDDAALRRTAEQVLEWFKEDVLHDLFKSALPPPAGAEDLLAEAVLAAARGFGATTADAVLGNDTVVNGVAGALGVPPGAVRAALASRGSQGAGGAGGQGAEASKNKMPFSLKVAFSMKDQHEVELRTRTIDYSVSAAEVRVASPQGLLSFLARGVPPESSVREVGLDAEFFSNLVVHVRPVEDLAVMGVAQAIVHFEYPTAPAEGVEVVTASRIFEPGSTAPQVFEAWIDKARDLAYRYRVELTFASTSPWRGKEPVLTSPWITTRARELVVHPLSVMDVLDLSIQSGSIDWKVISEVLVDVRIGGEQGMTERLSVSKDSPAGRVRARLPSEGDRTIEARSSWLFASGTTVNGDWAPLRGDTLFLRMPFAGARTLRLVPLLPAAFLDASVTIDLEDGPLTAQEVVTFAPGETRAKPVTIPTLSEKAPPARVQVFVTRQDGSFFQSDPVVTDDPVVLVTDRAGPSRRVEVRLLLAQKLSDVRLAAVKVVLLDPEEDIEKDSALFTEGRKDPVLWIVPVPADGELRYRYRVVRYSLDGTPSVSAAVLSSEPSVLVPAAG